LFQVSDSFKGVGGSLAPNSAIQDQPHRNRPGSTPFLTPTFEAMVSITFADAFTFIGENG
jgi:hypothetical protein